MGCGCGGGARGPLKKTALIPRQTLIQTVQRPAVNNVQAQSVNTQGLSSDKRSEEKKRRETILRKLGRL